VAIRAALAGPAAGHRPHVACLEHEPAYNDDRVTQAGAVAELATDPALDGPAPVLVAGDLNADIDSPVLRPLTDVLTDAYTTGGGEVGRGHRGSGGQRAIALIRS